MIVRLLVRKDDHKTSGYSKYEWALKGVRVIDVVGDRIKLRDQGLTEAEINAEMDRRILKTREVKEKQYAARVQPGDIITVRPDMLENGQPGLGEHAHNGGMWYVIRVDVGARTMSQCQAWELPHKSGDAILFNRRFAIDVKKMEKDHKAAMDANQIIEITNAEFEAWLTDKGGKAVAAR